MPPLPDACCICLISNSLFKNLKPNRSYSYGCNYSSFQNLWVLLVYVFRVTQTANNDYFHKIYSITHLVFVMETDWIICEVGIEFLYIQ